MLEEHPSLGRVSDGVASLACRGSQARLREGCLGREGGRPLFSPDLCLHGCVWLRVVGGRSVSACVPFTDACVYRRLFILAYAFPDEGG